MGAELNWREGLGRRLIPWLLMPLLILGAVAETASGQHQTRTKVFSSGTINRPIPDPEGIAGIEIAQNRRVRVRGVIRDVNLAVRITHPDAQSLELGAFHATPNGVIEFVNLKERGTLLDPMGADFGTGAEACRGSVFTVFDSQSPTSITDGGPPFAGRFAPLSNLRTFNRSQLRGRWGLELLDTTDGDAGVLNCWRIRVRYKPRPRHRR